MKNIFKTVAAFAAVVLAGCTTDFNEEIAAPQGGKTTVTIGLPESRTTLGELVEGKRKVYWTDGDMIVINGVTSAPTEINEENAGVATFEFDAVLTHPYSVFYPAELWKNNSTITLPAVQTYTAGSFAEDSAPMACYTEGAAPTLHHLAAVVRLSVKNSAEEGADNHNINRIEFRGNNGEQVSGDFSIDYATTALTGASTAEADKVVAASYRRNLGEGVVDFFVVVPAREYANGFTVRVIDELGHYMDLKSGAVTLAKGEIKAMPEFAFAPTGTLVNVEIGSAAELVAFAKAYNAGDFFGIEPFVINITKDIVFDDDTNDAWEPIGNIFGADNKLGLAENTTNYFHGKLYGNGHSIKNWKSGKPLFDYTGQGSLIEGLTIDSSCTLAVATIENYGTFVGYHRGDIINCHNNANITATGTWSGNSRIGGFVGRSVVGLIENSSMNGNITLDANYLASNAYVGGLIGGNTNAEGSVKNSKMTGNITFNGGVASASGIYFIGGIAGFMRGACTNCTTGQEGVASTINVTPAAKNFGSANVGGVVGQMDVDATINGSKNYANVTFGIPNATYGNTGIAVGGIVGCSYNDVNGVENHGNVYVTPVANTTVHHLWLGGVIGLSGKSGETVKISNAVNNGEVLFAGNANQAAADGLGIHQWITVGGILGYDLKDATTTIDTCTNNGLVGVTFKAKQDNRSTFTGGIAGMLYFTASKMVSCTNNGAIFNHNYNNTNKAKASNGGAVAGGLVGYAVGSTSATVTIENCTNNCTTSPTSTANTSYGNPSANYGLYGLRGVNGSLVGYAQYASISGCSSTTNLYQHQSGYVGGLAGWMDSTTINDCDITNSVLHFNTANTVASGGFVGLVTKSTISNNTFNSTISGTATTAHGVLAGNADAATTISNNKIKGTYYGAAITLSSAMVGTGTPTISGTELLTE